MTTVDSSPSNNGRGSDAWSRPWTHLGIDRRSAGYCRVTFDNPPINVITATTVMEVAELVDLIEQDPDLNVVVFDSANPAFYLTHHDTEHNSGKTAALEVGSPRTCAWSHLLVRLSRAPAVSIASIRGRVRGAGSEFVLACDLRFASREKTLLGRLEVGNGAGPGARSDGPARPPGRSWPRDRDPPRRRRSRTDRARSSTGTSTARSPTTGSTTRWIGSRHGLRAPTTM